MGKIFINATKNYGEKISTILKNSSERVDGIYYSLADVPQNQLEGLNSLSNVKFILKEFPLYYLVNDNVYINNFYNPVLEAIKNEEGKTVVPKTSERNNKLCCLNGNLEIPSYQYLPIESSLYVEYREELQSSVIDFYDKYYSGCEYLMTPTFFIDKVDTWKNVMIDDILKATDSYLIEHSKNMIMLSILIDVELFKSFNVANRIIKYVTKYPFINGLCISITESQNLYSLKNDDYQNVLAFIKELNFNGVKIYMNYSGIKDIPFSVLNIERFSIGWTSTYRNFDLSSKGIDNVATSSFGRKVRKILLNYYMTEIPLDYLTVYNDQARNEILGFKGEDLNEITFSDLEQIYWHEFLSIIKKNPHIENGYTGEELYFYRAKEILAKYEVSIVHLHELKEKLIQNGRMDDARKLENNNISSIIIQMKTVEEFKNKILI